jgi:hypothetical protein
LERRFRILCALSLVSFVVGPFAPPPASDMGSIDRDLTPINSRGGNRNKPSRIACPAADDYQDAMTLIDLANPTNSCR